MKYLLDTNVIISHFKGEYIMDVLARMVGGEFYEPGLDNRLDLTFG